MSSLETAKGGPRNALEALGALMIVLGVLLMARVEPFWIGIVTLIVGAGMIGFSRLFLPSGKNPNAVYRPSGGTLDDYAKTIADDMKKGGPLRYN